MLLEYLVVIDTCSDLNPVLFYQKVKPSLAPGGENWN